MPYKDPAVRKAYKAKHWKEYRQKHPDYHRKQMARWRAINYLSIFEQNGSIPRPKTFFSKEEELEYLIKEQAKDDRTYCIKRTPGIIDRKDTLLKH